MQSQFGIPLNIFGGCLENCVHFLRVIFEVVKLKVYIFYCDGCFLVVVILKGEECDKVTLMEGLVIVVNISVVSKPSYCSLNAYKRDMIRDLIPFLESLLTV